MHLDGVPAGAFGCWRAGSMQTWCGKTDQEMTPKEREAHKRRIKAMQSQRDADRNATQLQASEAAALIWKAAASASEHEYLARKGIQPYGVRMDGHHLLIPLRDADGILRSFQRISPAGEKRFHPGGRVAGCFFSMGSMDGLLILCEGFATGASLFEATGYAVAVAFNAGNLLAVAKVLRGKYPFAKIVVAADDDWNSDGNPGLTKAKAAARSVGGLLAVPEFRGDRSEHATDFNDLHRFEGLSAVKDCIDAVVSHPWTSDRDADGVILVNGADLTPEPVQWLWRDWLALGKLHILAGAPGQGKTTIAIAAAATVTQGGRWPDGTRCETGNVLIWSGEDDPADTLLPRLLAAGAERARCYFVTGSRIGGEVQSFDPARDMTTLEVEANRIGGVKLLMVDPVVSAVAGDSHKNTEVRRALQPLVDLASRLNAACLGISHFSKGGAGGDPAARVVGSIAFTAVARVVLVAAKVETGDGEERRILARAKSNIGPDEGGFEYTIELCEPLPGIQASYVAWGTSVMGTARELLREPEGADGEEKSAVDSAADFVRQVLADGLTPATKVKEDATNAGVSWASVRRAADKLRVAKRKGLGGTWYWKLPTKHEDDAQGAQPSTSEHLEQHECL